MLMIAEILQKLQYALIAILIGAIAFTLLAIAAYMEEELEYHPAVKEWFLQTMNKTTELAKMLIAAVEYYLVAIAIRLKETRTPKYKPQHAPKGFFEEEFRGFARGFDRNGGLLEKRAPRDSSGKLMSSDDLKAVGRVHLLSS